MKGDFLEKYSRLNKTPKAVLRSMFKTLMEDSSASNCAAEKKVVDNVAQALLDLEILDLRAQSNTQKQQKQYWQLI